MRWKPPKPSSGERRDPRGGLGSRDGRCDGEVDCVLATLLWFDDFETRDARVPATTMCQWHWGAYANGDNDDVVLLRGLCHLIPARMGRLDATVMSRHDAVVTR